eukprot:scaffold4604_cov257-Pinguiococcus_pyrenoidosus.AAC.7
MASVYRCMVASASHFTGLWPRPHGTSNSTESSPYTTLTWSRIVWTTQRSRLSIDREVRLGMLVEPRGLAVSRLGGRRRYGRERCIDQDANIEYINISYTFTCSRGLNERLWKRWETHQQLPWRVSAPRLLQ